jgi:hypothetical protein
MLSYGDTVKVIEPLELADKVYLNAKKYIGAI